MSTQPSIKQIPLIERFKFDIDCENITGPITALKKSYKELYRFSDFIAQDLTKSKNSLIEIPTNQRLIVLGASTVFITLLSWKLRRGVLGTFRNSVFGYFALGFFIAPEIYYPILNVEKKI